MSVAATRPGSVSLSAHQWTVDQRLEGSRSVEHVDLSASYERVNKLCVEPRPPRKNVRWPTGFTRRGTRFRSGTAPVPAAAGI